MVMTKHKIYGKVARTRSEIKKGLMFRKTPLKQQEGLLFDMETNKIQGFWMKNTFIPLDVIFLNSNFRVVGVVENTVPHSLESVKINKKSSYVIEVNAGETKRMGIRTNDYIDFYEYI
tara:strand:- start:268 stop:621 length:354 start_codon:yes stop_codon:yes gene_type:complete